MTKTILVTGANGYIGSNVVSALIDLGADVIAVSKHDDYVDKRARFIPFDVFLSSKTVYEDLGRPDVCIHLAWRNGFVHNDESHLQDLVGHYSFLRDMIEGGLRQLVVMGSMHEIGYVEGIINDDTLSKPQSLYGIAKSALRESIDVICQSKPVVVQWLRAYYIIGQDYRNHSIFTKLLEAARRGDESFPFTTGKNKYDFIDIKDLALQISLAALQEQVDGIINCCSGKPEALADRVERYIVENELHLRLEYGVYPDRAYDSPIVYGDTHKIQQIMRTYLDTADVSGCVARIERMLEEMGD